ncbi:hypothetical protein IJI79_02875 [Candidatus Saccharibacteria bacterium]|nr:hypothetical protein [Candidatus Saccharibacteria bacterium]
MKMYLDTSTNIVKLKLNDQMYEKDLGHDMAEKLLDFIHEKLQENGADWQDISEIKFMKGPGSFTGLRIGASIVNTLIHELNLNQPLVKINYGHPPNRTSPIK